MAVVVVIVIIRNEKKTLKKVVEKPGQQKISFGIGLDVLTNMPETDPEISHDSDGGVLNQPSLRRNNISADPEESETPIDKSFICENTVCAIAMIP